MRSAFSDVEEEDAAGGRDLERRIGPGFDHVRVPAGQNVQERRDGDAADRSCSRVRRRLRFAAGDDRPVERGSRPREVRRTTDDLSARERPRNDPQAEAEGDGRQRLRVATTDAARLARVQVIPVAEFQLGRGHATVCRRRLRVQPQSADDSTGKLSDRRESPHVVRTHQLRTE